MDDKGIQGQQNEEWDYRDTGQGQPAVTLSPQILSSDGHTDPRFRKPFGSKYVRDCKDDCSGYNGANYDPCFAWGVDRLRAEWMADCDVSIDGHQNQEVGPGDVGNLDQPDHEVALDRDVRSVELYRPVFCTQE